MVCTVNVKITQGNVAKIKLHYLRVPDSVPATVRPLPIPLTKVGAGRFTGTMSVQQNARYCLAAYLVLGAEIEIELAPPYAIYQPAGARWPVTASVPSNQTEDIVPFYFDTGSVQQ